MAVPKTIFEAIQLFNYRVAMAMGGGVITTIANKMRGYTNNTYQDDGGGSYKKISTMTMEIVGLEDLRRF